MAAEPMPWSPMNATVKFAGGIEVAALAGRDPMSIVRMQASATPPSLSVAAGLECARVRFLIKIGASLQTLG